MDGPALSACEGSATGLTMSRLGSNLSSTFEPASLPDSSGTNFVEPRSGLPALYKCTSLISPRDAGGPCEISGFHDFSSAATMCCKSATYQL